MRNPSPTILVVPGMRDNGWQPIPRRPLPFPGIGAVGHLNPAAGQDAWTGAEELVHAPR